MRCLTCNKSVPKGVSVCPFCGALLTGSQVMFGAPAPPAAEELVDEPAGTPHWEMHPRAPVLEPSPAMPAEVAQNQPPGSGSSEPVGVPRRRRIPLFRVLVLLAFVLLPLFSFLFEDRPSPRRRSELPVLREAIFCENVVEGFPRNPKAVFSLHSDRQVVLYSLWKGGGAAHVIALRWHPPQRVPEGLPVIQTRLQRARGGFIASSFLPLQRGMPVGEWRVELFVDKRIRAVLKFRLRE